MPPWLPPLLAVQFLTRLPVPDTSTFPADMVRAGLVRAVAWFPLVGTLVGCLTAAVLVGTAEAWPPLVAVGLALAVEARATGAFHEDAVADFADGFGGGQMPEDVRRIMKDSRIGSYGTVTLVLGIGLRAALTLALVAEPFAIVAAATFGRLVVVATMALVPPAPAGEGLAKDVGAGADRRTLGRACVLALPGLAPFAVANPGATLVAFLLGAVLIAWLRRLVLRRIGGTTGDCLGFAAYAGQLLFLLAAAA